MAGDHGRRVAAMAISTLFFLAVVLLMAWSLKTLNVLPTVDPVAEKEKGVPRLVFEMYFYVLGVNLLTYVLSLLYCGLNILEGNNLCDMPPALMGPFATFFGTFFSNRFNVQAQIVAREFGLIA